VCGSGSLEGPLLCCPVLGCSSEWPGPRLGVCPAGNGKGSRGCGSGESRGQRDLWVWLPTIARGDGFGRGLVRVGDGGGIAAPSTAWLPRGVAGSVAAWLCAERPRRPGEVGLWGANPSRVVTERPARTGPRLGRCTTVSTTGVCVERPLPTVGRRCAKKPPSGRSARPIP
jgi:hypothetical protein